MSIFRTGKMPNETGMVGILDVAIIGTIAGIAVYYLIFRKKKEDSSSSEVKQLTVNSNIKTNRTDSFSSSFVSKMQASGRNVIILYGSQTGTAEEFSSRLAKDAVRYGMKAMVADPEECELDEISKLADIDNNLIIFCMATYGEGDPTDNAQELFEWLNDNGGGVELNDVNYAVFGLGNKTYEHYNAMGKLVDTKLQEMGATRVVELGLGDDDCNIEEDFVTWKDKLWPAVCEQFNIDATASDISVRQYALSEPTDIPEQKIFRGEAARLGSLRNQKPPFDQKNPYLAKIVTNRELHNGGDRSCMHVEVDIEGSKLRYESGDHIAIYATNDSFLVDGIGKRLNIDLDKTFSLINVDEDASKKYPFPCPTTYRTALTHYLDITSPLRTNVLKDLAEYAKDEEEKKQLLLMVSNSPEGKDLYNNWILKDHRHILAVLEDMPSLEPAIDHLCEILSRLQPRYYSISSSPKLHPHTVHITAVLVDWTTPTKRNQKGVATWYMKNRVPTETLQPTAPVFIRKSQFRLPFKPTTPVIMVGPGTGIAPFRGFIQDRAVQKRAGKPTGEMVLYFGCRHKVEDYIYEDELKGFVEEGVLSQLHVAFSRDQKDKVYVQHLLRENKSDIARLLRKEDAHVYVCGDAKHMAHDVDLALQEALETEEDWTSQQAQNFLKNLRSRGRYSCDVWS